MSSEFPRYEINRKIRQILVSHNADMTRINYSFINKTVYMYGSLVRESMGDFSLHAIESIIRELMSIPRVRKIQFDLDNWVVSNEPGEMNIVKRKESGIMATRKHHHE